MILLYKLVLHLAVLSGTVVFVTSFKSYQWIGYVLALPFYYAFLGTVQLFLNYIIYFFSSPRILPEDRVIIEKGIPDTMMVVFFRPVFAKTSPEMQTVLTSMKQDIINNQEASKNVKYIVIDNTRDEGVKAWTRQEVSKLQNEFGKEVVFYMHRNVKCDFFKKVGILHDAIMLLQEGWTRPRNYTDPKWAPWTKGTRDVNLPTWDVIMGDVSALGIMSSVEDILAGREIKVSQAKKMKVTIVNDADNIWPKGSLRKLVAKILHPDNQKYTIFQPSIELSNPKENLFIAMNAMARMMYGFDPVVRWRVFNFQPFFGKGVFNTENYIRDIVKSEWLHPGKAASHDFQESLRAPTALVEDVYIWEKTFSNKLAELTRAAAWSWGDMETVRQFFFKPFTAGRRSHLQALFRILVSDLSFNFWLISMVVASCIIGFENLFFVKKLLYLFGITLVMNTVTPRIIVPVLNKLKKPAYEPEGEPPFRTDIFTILWRAVWTEVLSVLIFMLDMFYKPKAIISNYIQQSRGKPFVWKTGAMSEIETANLTPLKAYRVLWSSTLLGVILLACGIAGIIPGIVFLLLSPFIASFILGPLTIWATA